MSDQPQKTPLVELLRAVPEDLRAEWASQWDERGNPIGHTLSPVGKHCHEAADEITSLKAQLAAERERVERLRGAMRDIVNRGVPIQREEHRIAREALADTQEED